MKIGCHFHNNCGLALANTLAAIEAGCQNADCTITGMGRGAGNAETELLLSILKPEKINLGTLIKLNLMKTGSFSSYKNSI